MATFKEFISRSGYAYKRHKLVINFVVLGLFIFLSCLVRGFCYPTFLLLMFLALSEKNYCGIYYIVFSLPFVNILVFGSFGYIVGIAAGVYTLFNYIKVFFVERCKINIVSLVLILLVEVYLALPINPYSTMTFVKMAVFLVAFMLFEILREKCRLFSFNTLLYAYVIGLLLSAVIGLMAPISQNIASLSANYTYNGYKRFDALIGHPNRFAILSVAGVCCGCYLVFNQKYRILNIFLLLLILFFGGMTFSKSFFLLTLVISIFFVIKMFTLNYKKAFMICGIVLVCFAILYLLFSDIVVTIVTRFFSATRFDEIKEFDWSQFLTFRNDLWGVYLTKIFESKHNVLFGLGAGTREIEGYLSPHNTYIGTVYQTGIVGFALIFTAMIYCLMQIYKSASKKSKVDWFTYVPLLIIAMLLFVEDFLF